MAIERTLFIVLLAFAATACGHREPGLYMKESEPRYQQALARLRQIDPNFVRIAGDDIRGIPLDGVRLNCVVFAYVGSKIIEGKDRVICFDARTREYAGRL